MSSVLRSMKVLQVIDKLNIGGAERVFVDLSNLLCEKGLDISVLTFVNGGLLEKDLNRNISRVDFSRKQKYNFFIAYKLSKTLKKYNILHVHMRHVYRYVKFVCLLFGVKAKIILHDHYGKISIDKSIPMLFKSILKPNYYIGVSNELTLWAEENLKVKHVFKLSNIVRKQANVVKRNSKKEGLVVIGNIKPIKNQLFAIQLAALCNKKLTIIGRIQDKDYYAILLQEIKTLNLQDRVTFLHEVTNVQQWLPSFELGIMSSKSESGPLVLLEFLAQNIPFAAYKTGEVSQVLKTDLPHFFMDNFKGSDWIKRIHKIVEEKNQLEKIFNTFFSEESYTNKCLGIYQKIKNS